jgi:hypothetical protein
VPAFFVVPVVPSPSGLIVGEDKIVGRFDVLLVVGALVVVVVVALVGFWDAVVEGEGVVDDRCLLRNVMGSDVVGAFEFFC